MKWEYSYTSMTELNLTLPRIVYDKNESLAMDKNKRSLIYV